MLNNRRVSASNMIQAHKFTCYSIPPSPPVWWGRSEWTPVSATSTFPCPPATISPWESPHLGNSQSCHGTTKCFDELLAGDFMIFNYGILSIFEWLYDLYISLWYFEWVFKTPETGMLHPLEAFSDSTGSTRRQSTWRRGLDGLSLDLQLQKSLAPLSCLQRWVFLGEVPVKPKPLRASMGFPQQWVGPPNILWSFRRGIASNHMKYVVNKRYRITKCMCCTACDEACIPLHLVCICNILKMCHLFLYIIRAMYKYYTSHML